MLLPKQQGLHDLVVAESTYRIEFNTPIGSMASTLGQRIHPPHDAAVDPYPSAWQFTCDDIVPAGMEVTIRSGSALWSCR
jgi:hypothetical protein